MGIYYPQFVETVVYSINWPPSPLTHTLYLLSIVPREISLLKAFIANVKLAPVLLGQRPGQGQGLGSGQGEQMNLFRSVARNHLPRDRGDRRGRGYDRYVTVPPLIV